MRPIDADKLHPDVITKNGALAISQGQLAYAPTLDVKPVVKGKWISEIVDAEDWKGTKRRCYQPTSCSVCHKPCAIEYPFCPRCGAQMDVEPQESEDKE